MTAPSAALKALDRARAGYEADGYAVSVKERLPPPFEAFVADAVARRNDELVIVEVRPSDMSDQTRNRFSRLAEIMRARAGWRVDVVTYEPEVPPRVADHGEIVRRVTEARRVVDVSPDAAVLLLWSAIEGALVQAARKRGLGSGRVMPPRSLIRQLTIDGLLSDNQAAALDAFARRRHAIAHGMCEDPPDPQTLDWLARFALAAAENEVAGVDEMIDWFKAHHATPGEATPFGGTREGNHPELGPDPDHATGILSERFDTALEADLAEAVRVIQEGEVGSADQG